MTSILGILNITTDSFSDGGKYLEPAAALAQAHRLMADGADMLDIGAASSNPDAAPDISDWPLDKAVIYVPVDVKAIRTKLGMSQDSFAATFGISVAALRDWEQRRRVPRGPARALLQIIDREPEAARRALAG